MNSEQRIEIYENSPETIRKIYSSPETIELNKKVKSQFKLNDNAYNNFLNVMGDTILGLHHTKDLPQLLQKEVGLSADEAQRVVADLAEFLSPVLEREAKTAGEKQQELRSLGSDIGAKTTTNRAPTSPLEADEEEVSQEQPINDGVGQGAPASATNQGENSFESVRPMRTMEGDMQRIHGYGAYRDAHPKDDASEENEVVIRSSQDDAFKKPKLADTPRLGE